jgi:LmbE family N-acetylglucosaminyl deacetylase
MRFSGSKCALVVGAHPDDAVLGAGGTAALLKQNGWRVVVLTATKGGLGGAEAVREKEERASTAILSLELHQGGMQDGALDLQGCLEFLNSSINYYEPAIIFTHTPEDTHQDHITLTRAAVIAGRKCPCLLYYEGPSTRQFQPVIQIDVSSVWPRKIAAMHEYRSQLERLDLIRWAEGVAHFRSWPDASRTKVEAFQPQRISIDLADSDPLPSESPVMLDQFVMAGAK